MAYLEVQIGSGYGGAIAISANGYSLAQSSGCLTFFIGSQYPRAMDYFNALDYEGWTLMNSRSSSVVGMIDGLPFWNESGTYTFRGSGRSQIKWEDDRWILTGPRLGVYFSSRYDYEDEY